MNWENVLIIILSSALGYIIGAVRSFRDQKQKAYTELLPAIIQMAYNPNQADEGAFSISLMKLWLYGSKRVAIQMEEAVSRLHHPERELSVTEALQDAIILMRRDIQVNPFQRLRRQDVNHLYTRVIK